MRVLLSAVKIHPECVSDVRVRRFFSLLDCFSTFIPLCLFFCLFAQLGQGDTFNVGHTPFSMRNLTSVDLGSGAVATKVIAARYFTCVLLDDAVVK